MNIVIGSLKPSQWRDLTQDEFSILQKSLGRESP